ncbi:Eclosion hormone precursor, putative [Pediculus humanus corporis]|uniref:Eclosion hormone, putative n=1 Tax=Pediculus humanus subsp. corporis TaxID=121224 RepID=E0W1X8_PEDHC|nr:Eclosion hormone precursor, putative [Pediculus humanus corporis]EEB19572.1 Eclosion hormone precursor, putative [Pediculus humanus corporis]
MSAVCFLNNLLFVVVVTGMGMGLKKLYSILMAAVLLTTFLCLANSSILPTESNQFGICIRNCAQCKKMFGTYFEGQLCADACVKFKGKVIPDCEDLDSISPFLNKVD